MSQKRNRPVLAGTDRRDSFSLDCRDYARPDSRFQVSRGSSPTPAVQRIARHLAACGERTIAELLVALTAQHGADVLTLAESFRTVDPGILRALGVTGFPPALATLDGGRQ